ncbi:MAG: CdaR family protein [Bacillota bacterium]
MNNFFKERFLNNIGIKLFAIFFSLLFWVYVMDQVNPTVDKTIEDLNVQLLNVEYIKEKDMIIKNKNQFFVDVKVNGRRNDILTLKKSDLSLKADLLGYRSGINNIPVEAKSFNNDVDIVKVMPSNIQIELEKIEQKIFDVNVSLESNLPTNYIYRNKDIEFNKVKVTGPESKINNIEFIKGIFNLNGVTKSVNEKISLMPVNEKGNIVKGVTLEKDYTNLNLDIFYKKEIEVEPDLNYNLDEDYKLTSYELIPSEVKVMGKKENVDKIDKLKTNTINIEGFEKSDKLETQISLPNNVSLVNDKNSFTFKYNIEPIIIKEYKFNKEEIAFLNLDQSLDFKLDESDENITVQLKGVKSNLNEMTKKDIELQVDGKDFDKSTKTGKIEINIDNDKITDFELSKEEIKLQIFEKDKQESEDALQNNIE